MGSMQGTLQSLSSTKDSQQNGEDRKFEVLKAQLKMAQEGAREKEIALAAAKKEIEELIVKLNAACDQNLKIQKQLDETNGLLIERNKELEESQEEYLQQAMRGDALEARIGLLNFTNRELQNKLNGTDEGVMYVSSRGGDSKQSTSTGTGTSTSTSTSGIYKIVCSDFNLEDALRRRYADTDADAGLD